jgi:hypothetical protein
MPAAEATRAQGGLARARVVISVGEGARWAMGSNAEMWSSSGFVRAGVQCLEPCLKYQSPF